MDTVTNKKTYQVLVNYHYAEIYYVEAESEKAAIDMIENDGLECDEIYKDFDFYDTMEIKK
jgi:hypothetical protein